MASDNVSAYMALFRVGKLLDEMWQLLSEAEQFWLIHHADRPQAAHKASEPHDVLSRYRYIVSYWSYAAVKHYHDVIESPKFDTTIEIFLELYKHARVRGLSHFVIKNADSVFCNNFAGLSYESYGLILDIMEANRDSIRDDSLVRPIVAALAAPCHDAKRKTMWYRFRSHTIFLLNKILEADEPEWITSCPTGRNEYHEWIDRGAVASPRCLERLLGVPEVRERIKRIFDSYLEEPKRRANIIRYALHLLPIERFMRGEASIAWLDALIGAEPGVSPALRRRRRYATHDTRPQRMIAIMVAIADGYLTVRDTHDSQYLNTFQTLVMGLPSDILTLIAWRYLGEAYTTMAWNDTVFRDVASFPPAKNTT